MEVSYARLHGQSGVHRHDVLIFGSDIFLINSHFSVITARKQSCGKVMFLQVSVILSAGGACMVAGGMCGCGGACGVAMGGCAWLKGACVVALGHAWLLGGVVGGACMVAGVMCMVAGGHAWLWGVCVVVGGVCMVARGCIGYDEIRSMSGRYASYWNAFLLKRSNYCSLDANCSL